MDRSWMETGRRAAVAAVGNGAWLSGMAVGAFALALVAERLLALALG